MKNLFSKKMVAAMVMSMSMSMSFAGMCHAETVTLDLASNDSTMQIEVNGIKYTLTREAAASTAEVAVNNTSVAQAVAEVKASEELQKAAEAPVVVREPEVTGVIVDASGLGLETTFSPAILSEDGQSVYGATSINEQNAINKGMV